MKAPNMLFALKHLETILVTSASTVMEFEDFKAQGLTLPEGATAQTVDFIEMFEDAYKGFRLAPFKIECVDEKQADHIIAHNLFHMLRRGEAVTMQEKMIEVARLESELGKPKDRRTLAEIHGLVDDDPWDKSTAEQKEQGKKEAERMQAIRDAGGITADSFGGKVGEKINIHSVEVNVDANKDITSVNVGASKSTMVSYLLTIDDATAETFTTIFDEFALPENRILSIEGTTATIQLHDHQINSLTEILDTHKLPYTLTKKIGDSVEEIDAPIEGHENISIFFSVQIKGATVHEISPVLQAAGFDMDTIVAMRNVSNDCWFAFTREAKAEEAAKLINASGHHATVAAINRRGKSLIGEGSDAKVIDTNAERIDMPRPWNDRAHEIETMSVEESEALFKDIKPSEFLFIIEEHATLNAVVWITPETYFRAHDKIWEGDIPILKMLPEKILEQLLPDKSYMFKSNRLSPHLLKDNLCRWGFVESLRLRMFLNDSLSDYMASMA